MSKDDYSSLESLISGVPLFLAYTASAVPLNSGLSENRELSRVIEFTDDEGVVRSVDIDEEPDQDLLDEIEHDSENLYQLFTR